jgi:hypothetical protein
MGAILEVVGCVLAAKRNCCKHSVKYRGVHRISQQADDVSVDETSVTKLAQVTEGIYRAVYSLS